MDALDGRIITLFTAEPRVSVLEAARRLGVARGTLQARLARLEAEGVIAGWAPTLNPAAFGFPVSAWCSLSVRQGSNAQAVEALSAIDEVQSIHLVTGPSDLMVRVVARDNPDLQRVIESMQATGLLLRSTTVVVLTSPVEAGRAARLAAVATAG
ncbi:AsnC family transcriptional regulator [Tersicoccus solisilvae]|uniref:AsnC family transcriptional regulator n=1 Tax=Tersicoccus solisilvae TaxID=1882339 RepID=A0ABQ1PJT3_9MICC|nr:Lrp/AsnC family transcriptional regulator [Tersicoccus solisilvae]GGC98416.1 AsnC family transcriptional regulator [Tersicoccus solisilvae]